MIGVTLRSCEKNNGCVKQSRYLQIIRMTFYICFPYNIFLHLKLNIILLKNHNERNVVLRYILV